MAKKAIKARYCCHKIKTTEMEGRINTVEAKMVSREWFLTMWITIFLSILAVPYLYGRSDKVSAKCVAEEKPEYAEAFRRIGLL